MSSREHCERIGCGRFTFDLKATQVGLKRLKLCAHCRAIIFDRSLQRLERQESPFKAVVFYVADFFTHLLSEDGFSSDQVQGVTLFRPWASRRSSTTAENDNEIVHH